MSVYGEFSMVYEKASTESTDTNSANAAIYRTNVTMIIIYHCYLFKKQRMTKKIPITVIAFNFPLCKRLLIGQFTC